MSLPYSGTTCLQKQSNMQRKSWWQHRTLQNIEAALTDSQHCMCTGSQTPAPSWQRLTYSTKALLSLKSFAADSIFAEHTHSKGLHQGAQNCRKCIMNMVKVTIICAGFWGFSSRECRLCSQVSCSSIVNVVWQLEKRTLLTRKRDSSRYVCLCVLSYNVLFLCEALWH